jgi:hypothetical protein
VLVADAENSQDAALMQELLEQAGIRCLVKNTDPLAGLSGSLWSSAYGQKLLVLEEDEARARAVLTEAGWETVGPDEV